MPNQISSYRPSKISIAGFQCIEMVDINEPLLVGECGEIWIHEPSIFGVALTDTEQSLALMQELQISIYEVHDRSLVFLIDGKLLAKTIAFIKPFTDCSYQIQQAEANGSLLSRIPNFCMSSNSSDEQIKKIPVIKSSSSAQKIEEAAISIVEFLKKRPGAYKPKELQRWIRRRRQYVVHAIGLLEKRGDIQVKGSGKKGDPKRYHLKGFLSDKVKPDNEIEQKLFDTLIFN